MPSINFPTWFDRVSFDEPVDQALAKEVSRRAAKRVFVLMSATLRRNAALVNALKAALGDSIADLHADIPQHSPLPSVLDAAKAAKAAQADLLVSIGGGSIIDAVKVIQFCLAHEMFSEDAVRAWRQAGAKSPAKHPSLAHISVPTTLSGAEFTPFAGARNPASGLKEAFYARDLTPRALIFDSALTVLTPEQLWLSSGIRAIDHAVEGICSDRSHPLGDAFAQRGIAQLAANLRATKNTPSDVVSRRDSQFGAWFASTPLMSGVPMGASHAIGHVIGSVFHITHGLTSCVMLPAVMRYNYESVPDRLQKVAEALGGKEGQAAPDLVRDVIAGLGLPSRLGDVGLGRDAFDALANGAMEEGWLRTNPRPVKNRDDVIRILEMAL